MKTKYTAHATSTGGRTGHAETDDGRVAVILSVPRELDGDGGPGTNPEQLFALGYSSCFWGAMKNAARRLGKKLPVESTVSAAISYIDREDGIGATIGAELTAHVPGMDPAEVEEVMALAHTICPYSHLITQVGDVRLSAV